MISKLINYLAQNPTTSDPYGSNNPPNVILTMPLSMLIFIIVVASLTLIGFVILTIYQKTKINQKNNLIEILKNKNK